VEGLCLRTAATGWPDVFVENNSGMISTGENSRFVRQSSLATLLAESSSRKERGTGEEK
jgi:hypothetical protein